MLGLGGVDVRNYADVEAAAARCVAVLGGIDVAM